MLKRKQKCGYGTVFYRFRSERGPWPPMDLFRNGTDKTGTGQVPFTRQILSEPFVFLSELFRSCKRALN